MKQEYGEIEKEFVQFLMKGPFAKEQKGSTMYLAMYCAFMAGYILCQEKALAFLNGFSSKLP